MSYILDALKKAEQERKHGTVPDPLTIQDIPAREQRKRPLWPYLLLVALLANAGLLAWWLVPPQNKKAGNTSSQTMTQHNAPKTPDAFQSSSQTSMIAPPLPGDPLAPQPGTEREGQTTTQPYDTAVKPAGKSPPVVQQNKQMQAKAEPQKKSMAEPAPSGEKKAAGKTPPGEPQPVPQTSSGNNTAGYLKDLPPSVQKSLPAFSISAHLFSSDPTSRMAKVNGQMMREGQELSAGLKLEEITADGVVFSYQSHRFHIGLK